MPEETRVLCCPCCRKLVEAKDYMNPALLGVFDSVLPTMDCPCGYHGLPIQLSLEEYKRWTKG